MRLFAEPLLALETSCDETSAAVVVGRQVLSNVIASQIEMHQKWGGVVPEAAARAHVEAVLPVISQAVSDAGFDVSDLRAVAVTNRPGLVGALSVGVSTAKALSFGLKIPLIGIHHLEGHLLSTLSLEEPPPFPHTCLIVSGGHTELVDVLSPGEYRIVGQTRDDAAGEAFDKSARLLGLGYPGGLAIQTAAIAGDPQRYPLPAVSLAIPSTSALAASRRRSYGLPRRRGTASTLPPRRRAFRRPSSLFFPNVQSELWTGSTVRLSHS